jgi:hypothetical protein
MAKAKIMMNASLKTVKFGYEKILNAWVIKDIKEFIKSMLKVGYPKRSPGELSCEDKKSNQELAKIQLVGEHINRKLKGVKILFDRYRNRRKRVGLRFNLIAGLYNYELRLFKTKSV